MTVDLYHRISLSYTDSPDVRVTWLENLAVLQANAGNLEEAAACKLGTCRTIWAVMSKYLRSPSLLRLTWFSQRLLD